MRLGVLKQHLQLILWGWTDFFGLQWADFSRERLWHGLTRFLILFLRASLVHRHSRAHNPNNPGVSNNACAA
jgi:hypothetical protein